MVALASVVVDDVEDDLDARVVQPAHHRLELADRVVGRGVAHVRREEADGVVAPVVDEASIDEVALVDVLMHRQQLDRRDAELDEVLDGRRRAHPRVRAAQLLGDVGMATGEAPDVDLVDEGRLERGARWRIVAPAERAVDHDRLGHERRRVALVGRPVLVADPIAEERVVPAHGSVQSLGVRVDEQLCRVEAVPVMRRIGPVHAVAVALAGARIGQVAVPDELAALGEAHALLVSGLVEEAQVDGGRVLAEEREVHPRAVPGRAERIRLAPPDPHGHVERSALGMGAVGLTERGYRPRSIRGRALRRHRPGASSGTR